MKIMLETFSILMNAVTFAEAGEFETARQMMPVSAKEKTELRWHEAVLQRKSVS